MKFIVVILLIGACQSAPHEGLPLLHPGGIGGVFKGLNSETIIQGPDGSQITSKEESGSIIQHDGLASSPIIVAEPEPVQELLAPSVGPIIASTGAPLLISSASPELLAGEIDPHRLEVAPLPQVVPIEIVEQDPHIIETEIIEAPEFEPEQSSDLQGPSGRIITKGSASIVSGPASTTITEPRRIIIAPPKINIPLVADEVALQAAVITASTVAPVVAASTVTPLPSSSFESRSTLIPVDGLGYSSTPAPIDLGYSTSLAPGLGSTVGYDSSRINLGGSEDLGQSVPILGLSASNGIINGQDLGAVGAISSTESPILSSTLGSLSTEGYQVLENHPVPISAYLSAPVVPSVTAEGLADANIQKIPRIQDSIVVDDRIDMGYSQYTRTSPRPYRLPQVLGDALSNFYARNSPKNNENLIGIDDKMGELNDNEIYDSRYLPSSPDLSQSKYLGPALASNGLDASEVQLAQVPLSSVTRLADGAYEANIRYGRHAKLKN